MVFDYIDGGADDEWTLRENSEAFHRYSLRHKVLVNVKEVDTSTTLLGQKIDVPFITSPTAGNRLFHKNGEMAVARAVARQGTIYSLSALSSFSIEDIAAATSGPKWFQMYAWKDRGLIRDMLQRAKEKGYQALVLTADFAVTGNRERDPRNGFTIPPKIGLKQMWEALRAPLWTLDYLFSPAISYANISKKAKAISLVEFIDSQVTPAFDWNEAEWLLGEWAGPSALKGVVHSDDAKTALKTGFNAITVSNHGGRQLDSAVAPITVLPEIVDTVGDDAEVILDGGVRRGTDIIKALALGAKAVSFGRPYLYGLAAGGERGVKLALSHLNASLRRDMALAGVTSIAEINENLITRNDSLVTRRRS